MRPFEAEWDALAVASGSPFAAPAWVKAWFEHLRPERSRLRVVFVSDGARLVGVGPFCAVGGTLFPVGRGAGIAPPLAASGMRDAVGVAIAASLAADERTPTRIELTFARSSGDWAAAIGGAWPGRPLWRRRDAEHVVPYVELGDGFDEWMAAKSSSFRREARRKRKKLDEAGARFRYADAASLERDVTEFMRLHRQRLAGQGGTGLTDRGVERMLVAVGRELLASGRFRLLCLEVGDTFVAGQLLLGAGAELSAWNSGFDEGYSDLSPSMQCLIRALEDASESGARTMSLGPGGQEYKSRLADAEDVLESDLLIPRGPRYPLVRLGIGTRQMNKGLRAAVRRRLPAGR
ncbi:MAG TPA: GNAT family N-acetyltransferase [Solirubrobacterales bacterium]|jgi:CelD/BcsL family acetyltransferase involved in cellulose biosynthesis